MAIAPRISTKLLKRLQTIAEQEGRSPDDVLRTLLDNYTPVPAPVPEAPKRISKRVPPVPSAASTPLSASPTPVTPTPVPPVSEEDDYYSLRNVRRRIYARARRIWEQRGDSEKAALTDEQLDEQFWLFDQDDIPRLKSEQGTITAPS
jgi:hypothetical protein